MEHLKTTIIRYVDDPYIFQQFSKQSFLQVFHRLVVLKHFL